MKTLTNDFLLDLFAVCIKEKNIFFLIVNHLKQNYIYDEDYRNFWIEVVKYYTVYDKSPKFSILEQRIENKNKNGKHDDTLFVLKKVSQRMVLVSHTDEIINEFQTFILQNKFVETYNDLGDLWNKGNKDKAFELFKQTSQYFQDFNLSGSMFDKVFDGFETRMIDRINNDNQKRIRIPALIDPIDDQTDGGLVTGETELWLGDSGVGKSKMLVTRGISSARQGLKVLHVQAEGTREQCLDNYDACWTGQLYKDVKSGNMNMTKYKAYRKVVDNIGKGEIYVRAIETFDAIKISQVRKWLIDLIKEVGEIHHLIIDYFELLDIDKKINSLSSDGERLRQLELGKQFKNLAVEFNILVTTATQTSDISPELLNDPKFIITRHNLGSAKRKIEPFSYFFTINQTREEKKEKLCRVWGDKLREHPQAPKPWSIPQNLAKSRFFDKKRYIEMQEYGD